MIRSSSPCDTRQAATSSSSRRSSPGARRADGIRHAGRLCAGFDRVIIKEDIDRRGRQEGEIARLLTEGLTEGGLSPDAIEVKYEENEAINRGLDLLRDDDL